MLNSAKTMMDVCSININKNIIINICINIHINIKINININITYIHHCFGPIEHFLARVDMKIRWVGSAFNFLLIQMVKTKLYMIQIPT